MTMVLMVIVQSEWQYGEQTQHQNDFPKWGFIFLLQFLHADPLDTIPTRKR